MTVLIILILLIPVAIYSIVHTSMERMIDELERASKEDEILQGILDAKEGRLTKVDKF